MPRPWYQRITSFAVNTTGTPQKRTRDSALKRVVSAAVSSLFVLGLFTQARLRETQADFVSPQQPASTSVSSPSSQRETEAAVLRSETAERLKTLEAHGAAAAAAAGTTNAKPASGSSVGSASSQARLSPPMPSGASAGADQTARKTLRELLQARIRSLDEFAKLSQDLKDAMNPEPSPEEQTAQAKAELGRLEAHLAQAAMSPDSLLPPSLLKSSAGVADGLGAEFKDAIEATTSELKEWRTKLENLRGEVGKGDGLQNKRRAERDKVFQHVAGLKAKGAEFEAAVTDAQTAEARRLAQDRLVNFQWEDRVETLRLQVVEAQLALEVRLAGVHEIELHEYHAQAKLAELALEEMRARYRTISEDRERTLTAAAVNEEKKARSSQDPLERFRARRTAELLALEAQVCKTERTEATNPPPTYEEQRTLADRAEKDFAGIKELLDDGRVSRLDAIRLNNDFRRIGPERERLLRTEMAMVEAQLQFYEDALTNVELELIQDSLHDRFEHDLLRERVSATRWAEGESILNELERKHRELLIRKRNALEKLSERTSHTLQQVSRRLAILDEEYGFIRTQIFWVRDQDPIGAGTMVQATREFNHLAKGILRLAQEIIKARLWCQPSAEFVVTTLALLALLLGLIRLRQGTIGFKLARAVLWPVYLVFLAYASRVAPWPRSFGILVSAILTAMAMALLAHELVRWSVWPPEWATRGFGLPAPVARQLERAARFLVIVTLIFLLPVYLFDHELIAPEGRPITAPALGRLLVIGFELVVWGTCMQLLRRSSALLEWLAVPLSSPADPSVPASQLTIPSASSPGTPFKRAASHMHAGLRWLAKRRRMLAVLALVAIASIIVLDIRGYSFTARRLAAGGSQTIVLIAVAIFLYRAIGRVIDRNAWRWALPSRSWAMALTSAMALRASSRSRGTSAGSIALQSPAADSSELDYDVVPLEDLAAGLRRLCAYAVTVMTVLAAAWIWDLDMALARFLLSQPVWSSDGQAPVTLGNVTQAAFIGLLGAFAWRYMSTLFAVTVFPRMPDDPGVRFAVVTLCRYAVLGLTTLGALSAIHLDLAKIGVVLAALGVGLGFGLQEIVSNFVCGIILLLERPIRIGDVVTVAGNTGTVDRINIRATTIVNSDNQSMIVPNREFITGNLVNWTLKDKILRVPIKVGVAYGTDPDRVVGLLLAIARQDADVLQHPAPSASLEGFGDSALTFGLYAFVPEPGLAGGVRHRLCTEIQRRFVAEGIVIPFPTHELHVNQVRTDLTRALESPRDEALSPHARRHDAATRTPPPPHTATNVLDHAELSS
jgi:potassium efflux system protein